MESIMHAVVGAFMNDVRLTRQQASYVIKKFGFNQSKSEFKLEVKFSVID